MAASARAEPPPLKTWGGKEGITSEGPPDPPPSDDALPPTPPVPSVGTPVGVAEKPMPAADDTDAEGVVRAPGKVGLRYVLEGVEVAGNPTTLTRVVLRYVPFHAGDTLDVDDPALELTRFRLLGTGFFRAVELSLKKGSRRGTAILVVHVRERNTIVVNDLWLGLSSDAEPNGAARPLTAFGGLDISENNLAGTGITVGGAVALADRQLALRARFADPQFLGTSWTVETQLLYNHARDFFGNRDVLVDDPQQPAQDFAVALYERFGGLVGVGHDIGTSTRLFVDYRLERIDASLPLAASHKRGLDIEPIDFHLARNGSTLSDLRATLVHDTRDDPFLTTRGTYFTLVSDLAPAILGSDYPFFKLQTRLASWFELPKQHVIKLELTGGAIVGRAPLFERFYVGDFTDLLPDRVLDLNFDRRPPPNFFSNAIGEVRYGDYAAKVSAEYRIPLYRGQRAIYGVDLFGSVGLYGVAGLLDLTHPARGYDGLRKVPIDFTFNLGIRASTALGGVTVGISTLVGFIPLRESPQ